MTSDNGGWTTISRDDKKRVMRRGRRSHGKSSVVHGNAAGELDDPQVLSPMIERCMNELSVTPFFQTMLDKIPEFTIQCIVCYGVGNFAHRHCSASLWQLACALLLRDRLQASMVFFDPCTTEFERVVLSERQVEVLTENERGRRIVTAPTLFFMPHCPLRLYENVLETNWPKLESLWIIGNHLGPIKDHYPCIKALHNWIRQERLDLATKQPGDFERAFNDTYWISSPGCVPDEQPMPAIKGDEELG